MDKILKEVEGICKKIVFKHCEVMSEYEVHLRTTQYSLYSELTESIEQFLTATLEAKEKEHLKNYNKILHEVRELGEVVICAAIQFKCGKLIRGHRHGDCIRNAIERATPIETQGAIQGFITSKNRFVDRKEGMEIQLAAGIKSAWQEDGYHGDILFSEDLY